MRPVLSYARFERSPTTHAEGFRTAQATYSAAAVLAAAPLDRLPRRRARGVRGTLPVAPGYPAFVLCQCPQESVLLSRLSAWRRPDPFRAPFPAPHLSRNPRPAETE